MLSIGLGTHALSLDVADVVTQPVETVIVCGISEHLLLSFEIKSKFSVQLQLLQGVVSGFGRHMRFLTLVQLKLRGRLRDLRLVLNDVWQN